MVNEFDRYSLGYNISQFIAGAIVLVPAATVTISDVNGPGEIMGWQILKYAGANYDMNSLSFVLTIDGVVVWSGNTWNFAGGPPNLGLRDHFCTCDIQSTDYMVFSHRLKYPYDSSFSIVWTNGGAGNLSLFLGAWIRRGG